MHKIKLTHRASVVTYVRHQGPRSGFRQRHSFEKFANFYQTSQTQLETHVAPATHLGRQMGTAHSASTLGDLKTTRQSRHKLVIGKWNITSLTGKEQTGRGSQMMFPKCCWHLFDLSVVVLAMFSWMMGGDSSTPALRQQSLPRLEWVYL